jgi:coenzyme PQQ synthesis protein D (PqqD)
MLALMKTPIRRYDVASRIVDGETVILDRDAGLVHRLNPTASYIWSSCDGHNTPEVIARALADDYGQPCDAMMADVLNTIDNLRQLRLLD